MSRDQQNTFTKAAITIINKSGLHPHRTGFCDGLFGRECKSPWSGDGWKSIRKNAEYINGYMKGEEARANGAGMPQRPSTCQH